MDPKRACLLTLTYLVSIIYEGKTESLEVWILQNEDLTPVKLTSYQDFDTRNVYIMHVQEQDARKKSPEIYCWVGALSSLDDAVQAIVTALTTDLFPTSHLTKGIKKEFQDRESRDFMEMIRPASAKASKYEDYSLAGDVHEEINGQKPWLAETRMILVMPLDIFEDTTRVVHKLDKYPSTIATLKEVEFSSDHIENDRICLIAFNSKKIYLHCGKQLYHKSGRENYIKKAARFIANKIMQELCPAADVFQTTTDFSSEYSHYFVNKYRGGTHGERLNEPILKRLNEEFDEISKVKLDRRDIARLFTPSELEAPIMNLKIKRMTMIGNQIFEQQDYADSFSFFISLAQDECYIINPDTEPFNMLVWMGKRIRSEMRKKCIADANNIIARERGFITYIDEKHTTLNTSAFKFHPAEFIQFMERMYESWTDVFYSTYEEPGYGKF